jgi:hypothetical protein
MGTIATTALDDRAADATPLRQRRMAHRSRELAELLDRRPDLWGVYGPADVAVEFTLWCA